MNYTDDMLKKLQETEKEILVEIIRVCEENNITWFTVGGTTLGAVRHNGFIPWDDDIDIGMMRDDYDKFLEIAPKCLKKGYVLQQFVTENKSPAYFAKVRKDNTIFAEHSNKSLKIHLGIYVDIMPYDKISEDKKQRQKYNQRVKIWHEIYKAKMMWLSSKPISWSKQAFVKTCVRSILHILLMPVSKNFIYGRLEKAIRKYNSTGTKMVSSRGKAVFECLESDILPPIDYPFEDITVKIPNNYHKVLSIQYGDYMQLPPEEKRYGHMPSVFKL